MNARESENYLTISRSSSASKSVEIFGPKYIGDDFFLGPNLVSFNPKLRTVFISATAHGSSAGYKISKVNFHIETKILVSMSEEI